LLTAGVQASAGDGGTGAAGVCTAQCDSNDDCEAESKTLCPAGFACAVAASTGRFACKKICVCRTDLDPTFNSPPELDGGTVIPCACHPSAKQNPSCAAGH
jgi:hypothetical protein